MYTINKIECFFPDGFKQVITTDNVVEEIPVKQVERFLTQTDFQTTDYPDLQARKLLKYSKVRNKYQVTFYVEAGANLTLLQTAKYLKITLQDGTIIPFIDTNELTLEQISNTGWKGLFVFTELYSNTDNEISYLTYPEIGSTNVNKLKYDTNKYIYTQIKHTTEYVRGQIATLDIEDIANGIKSIDYQVLKCRFYLTLAQKNDLMAYLHLYTAVFTDYLGNEFTSIELIDPKIEAEPDIKDLYSFDLVLKYNQIINYYE